METEIKDNSGKFCHRRCEKYKFLRRKNSDNCKEWAIDFLDLSSKEDFEKIKNANFVLINEQEIDKI